MTRHAPRNNKRCAVCSRTANRDGRYCAIHRIDDGLRYKKSKGWVYVVDTGLRKDGQMIIKIGFSAKPQERLQALQAANPFCRFLFRNSNCLDGLSATWCWRIFQTIIFEH